MSVTAPSRGLRVYGVLATAAATLAAVAPPSSASDEVMAEDGATSVLAVVVDSDAGAQQVDELVDRVADLVDAAGGEVRLSDPAATISAEVPAEAADAIAVDLGAHPAVDDVVLPVEFSLWRRPNDVQFAQQRRYLREIAVPRAWNRARGTASTTIAVIDSGVATSHPDLRGRVADTYNAVDGSQSVVDRIGHGTSVAGVAAATTDNRIGVSGVGWRTAVLAVKVADDRGRIFGDSLAAGIRWATQRGADVVNLSLGATQDDPLVRDAVADAVSAGVVVVAAVSNSGLTREVYPAAYPGVLAVAATQGRRLASFSDRGRTVDVAAPGVGIRAAVPGGYARVDGTSFAAALVSGQAALVRAAMPSMRADRVRRIITGTTRQVGVGSRAVDRVHVFASVRRALGVPTAPRAVKAAPRAASAVVSWRPPAASGRSPVMRYRIDIRRSGGAWSNRVVVADDQRQVRLSGLRPGARYQVKVIALNAQGVGVHSRGTAVRPR